MEPSQSPEIQVPPVRPPRPSVSRWFQAVPFFFSAVLFLSGFFAVFSPLPLLLLFFEKGRPLFWMAVFTNGVLVFLAGGALSLSIYGVAVLVLVLALPEFLRKRFSIEAASAMTLLVMVLAGVFLVWGVTASQGLGFVEGAQKQAGLLLDYLLQNVSGGTKTQWMGDLSPEEWKKELLLELPSAALIFGLVLIWANGVALLRFNPKGIREFLGLGPNSLKHWKAPEILIWPTIAFGFLFLVNLGWVSDVGINLFKFLMAIYALQGLSILSFFFEAWKVSSWLRTLGFILVVFLMMPLLLSLGFFDLWFDFRGKFRQS